MAEGNLPEQTLVKPGGQSEFFQEASLKKIRLIDPEDTLSRILRGLRKDLNLAIYDVLGEPGQPRRQFK